MIERRENITKFNTMRMVGVRLPTADGRELLMSRHTQPEAEHCVLLGQRRLKLPEQPPLDITACEAH